MALPSTCSIIPGRIATCTDPNLFDVISFLALYSFGFSVFFYFFINMG